ncbi:hypothetical protein RBEAN4_1345 [Rickettsia bellii str. RML An4]|uniref:Uncharacterized protein n=1 Tax=Rickettsia bellii str. RML An4 TaxID=1359193 RepID=A0A0F3QDI4_RICBE|nr:hypothetical protein RBEAN4_1345 [Rickettsia bellii str. RML An4]
MIHAGITSRVLSYHCHSTIKPRDDRDETDPHGDDTEDTFLSLSS